jgi:hypothetical protein
LRRYHPSDGIIDLAQFTGIIFQTVLISIKQMELKEVEDISRIFFGRQSELIVFGRIPGFPRFGIFGTGYIRHLLVHIRRAGGEKCNEK